MDGTIYREQSLFDGIIEMLDKIKNAGARFAFITNNPSKSVKDYIKKLGKMGIKAKEEHFFTSTQATTMILKEKFGKQGRGQSMDGLCRTFGNLCRNDLYSC